MDKALNPYLIRVSTGCGAKCWIQYAGQTPKANEPSQLLSCHLICKRCEEN